MAIPKENCTPDIKVERGNARNQDKTRNLRRNDGLHVWKLAKRQDQIVRRDSVVPDTKIVLPPRSHSDHLRAGLARCVADLNLDSLPVARGVSIAGIHDGLDASIDALVKLWRNSPPTSEYALQPNHAVFKSYQKTVMVLQKALANPSELQRDTTILTIEMLGFIDSLMLDPLHLRLGNGIKHFMACSTLLLAQKKPTDLSRMIMYQLAGLPSFIQPCWAGQPSPYENTVWVDCDPHPLRVSRPTLDRLRKSNFQRFIRLPRLICATRAVREGDADADRKQTLGLLAAEAPDQAAENWLLHRVKIVPTVDVSSSRVIPYSYRFVDLEEMNAGIHYWQNRIVVETLQSALDLERSEDEKTIAAQEQSRLATNIFMCWQQAYGAGLAGRTSMTCGLIVAWTALMNQIEFRGVSRDEVGKWLQKMLMQSYEGWIVGNTIEDINAASAVVSGGPLEGPLVALLRGAP